MQQMRWRERILTLELLYGHLEHNPVRARRTAAAAPAAITARRRGREDRCGRAVLLVLLLGQSLLKNHFLLRSAEIGAKIRRRAAAGQRRRAELGRCWTVETEEVIYAENDAIAVMEHCLALYELTIHPCTLPKE